MIPLTSLPTAAAITAASAPAAPLNQLLVIVHCCDINHQVARQERRFAEIFPSVRVNIDCYAFTKMVSSTIIELLCKGIMVPQKSAQ